DTDTIDVKTEKTYTSGYIENLLDYHNKHIFYLPAARKGPEDFYPKSFDEFNFLGSGGEFIIDYFFKNRSKTLKKNMIKDKSGNTLETQVNYWLNKILKVRLKVEDLGITNILSAKFSYGGNNDVRPYHIGAGVSYITGIIISSLSAEPEDILIIENPEIHLHPKAQADLTEFLCFIANAGIQIIVESHSDHIFNGIRKAVAKKYINKNKTAIHFFELDNEFLSRNMEIEISDTGGIITYKKGLFDQFDDDLDELLGL
ncbi:MAG: DUF3696 domain-containing protein, partial [Deltaproteobacteria bacterium]|nr:DUF3696 domain-containing protein [Deltaproteobacteria bacterium]